MIGILGGMGTQAGLDFCNKLAKLNKGKVDQKYPLFLLYNKSNIPGRPENLHKYNKVLKSLLNGCKFLERSKCKFIVIPCNTAHYWYNDLQKKINIPIISMPKEVFVHAKKKCKKNSKIGLLATEGTIKTGIYNHFFDDKFKIIYPSESIQLKNVNKAIELVKMGKIKNAAKIIKPAVNFLIKMKCKKIILGCTELPIAIFAFKSFQKIKRSKTFLDPNLILAEASMKKY
ncbi:MAG: aspartate/glutamate racemase family protein [Pelagibacteraceae bacterium]